MLTTLSFIGDRSLDIHTLLVHILDVKKHGIPVFISMNPLCTKGNENDMRVRVFINYPSYTAMKVHENLLYHASREKNNLVNAGYKGGYISDVQIEHQDF